MEGGIDAGAHGVELIGYAKKRGQLRQDHAAQHAFFFDIGVRAELSSVIAATQDVHGS